MTVQFIFTKDLAEISIVNTCRDGIENIVLVVVEMCTIVNTEAVCSLCILNFESGQKLVSTYLKEQPTANLFTMSNHNPSYLNLNAQKGTQITY